MDGLIWSALQFSVDGSRVLLRNSNGEAQSITEPAQGSAVAASMLNSGNFVLYDSSSRIVWASFDQQTDTLLVGRKLAQNSALRSSTFLTNQSLGNFELWMEPWGSLTAYPKINIQMTKYAYWSSFTDSTAGQNVTVNSDQDGLLYLGNSTGFTVKNLTGAGLSVNKTNLIEPLLMLMVFSGFISIKSGLTVA